MLVLLEMGGGSGYEFAGALNKATEFAVLPTAVASPSIAIGK